MRFSLLDKIAILANEFNRQETGPKSDYRGDGGQPERAMVAEIRIGARLSETYSTLADSRAHQRLPF